jgi:hypothetical protein
MAETETIFLPANFRFENFVTEVSDVTPVGVSPPKTILDSDQDLQIKVSWENHGLATGMVDGRWHLLVMAESQGPGPEVILVDPGDHIFDLNPGPEPRSYSRTVDVPAGTLPVVGGHGVTLYKLITSLTYFDAAGNRGPIAAYEEGPIIQIYESTL